MKIPLLAALFLVAGLVAGSAMQIPSYRLESWCLQADEIVLCDELEAWVETTDHGSWTTTRSAVRCRVVRTFKGDLEIGRDFTPEYDSVFCRQLRFGLKEEVNSSGENVVVERRGELPAGRALLFLKKGKKSGSYEVLTAKLIQEDGVYQYGQFQSNPGPVVLAPQKPENFSLRESGKYGEKELLEDLQAALKKAVTLSEPEPWFPGEFLADPSGENRLHQILSRGKP